MEGMRFVDTPDNVTQYLQVLFLYKEGRVYQFDQGTNKCDSWDSGQFTPWGVPDDAMYRDTYTMGAPGAGMEVVEWSYLDHQREHTYIFTYTSADSGCYPVMCRNFPTYDRKSSNFTYVYDVTQGVSDPSHFIPPGTCPLASEKLEDVSETTRQLMEQFKACLMLG